MIRILRPGNEDALVSARVFEDSFASSLAPELSVERVGLAAWLDTIFGRAELRPEEKETQSAFLSATQGFDFLCPNYQAIPLAPLLMDVRNRSRAPIRLLLIAHAPGAYALEWALLRPLLRSGDVIVAPTQSARGVIDFLCPELTPFTRVIPHPIRPLPTVGASRGADLVSLTRMHPSKLLHRQIEAMAVLRDRGVSGVNLRIAGSIHDSSTGDVSPYARSLAEKIKRLRLEDRVELVGLIDGEQAKASFLGGAALLLNLSTTIEESFGKSIVESLSCGVPVLGTRWNGFPEVIGEAGACVPVDATTFGADVSASELADAIQALLKAPPNRKRCHREAKRSSPRRVRRLYRKELEAALEASSALESAGEETPEPTCPGAPSSGLLSDTAPLTRFSWKELFALHLQDATRRRAVLAGAPPESASEPDQLRSLLLLGIQAPLSRFLAGTTIGRMGRPQGSTLETAVGATDLLAKTEEGARSRATPGSRLACLALLASCGKLEALRAGVESLRAEGLHSLGSQHHEVEVSRLSGEYQRAFQMSVELEDPLVWGELAAHRLRQLAAVCREWNLSGMALPWLREWLERFPDSPDSGMVWLDRSANAVALAPDLLEEARQSFDSARRLLGTSVDLRELETCIQRAEARRDRAEVEACR